MLTFFSLYDKSGLFFLAFLTAIIHECGHIISAVILGLSIKSIYFLPYGIKMNLNIPLSLVSRMKKIILFASGSVTNILCFVFICFISKNENVAAGIHLATAFFNLLPIGTLDGGRILKEIIAFENDELGDKICDVLSLMLSIILFIVGTMVLLKTKYNISLIVTSLYLAFTVIIRQKC